MKVIGGNASAQDFNDNFAEVNSKAESANGGPKKTYATLAELQAAYPTGAEGAYLVESDGRLYWWENATWTQGTIYQSVGIGNNSVTSEHIENVLAPTKEINEIGFVKTKVIGRTQDDVGTTIGFIASANHGAGEGSKEYSSSSYYFTELIPLYKGQKLRYIAYGTENILPLTRWSQDDKTYLGNITQENTSSEQVYTATEEVEFVRICGSISVGASFSIDNTHDKRLGNLESNDAETQGRVSTLEESYDNIQIQKDNMHYGFVTGSGHADGAGVLKPESDASAYKYSDIIRLKKGRTLYFNTHTYSLSAALSKWQADGVTWIENLVEASNKSDREYTATDTVEYLRVVNRFTEWDEPDFYANSNGIQEQVDNALGRLTPLEVDIEVLLNKTGDGIITPVITAEYFASSTNTSNPEGGPYSHPEFGLTEAIKVFKGETIRFFAQTSTNTVMIAKVGSDGVYIESLLNGEGSSASQYQFVPTEDMYIRIGYRTSYMDPSDFYVLRETVRIIAEDLDSAIKENESDIRTVFRKTAVKAVGPQAVRKPTFCFSFDDGNAADDVLAARFKEFGFTCGWALNPGKPQYPDRVDTYLKLQEEGFCVCSHSNSHPYMSDAGDLTLEEARQEMYGSLQTMKNDGFDCVGWIQPYTSLDPVFVPLLKDYYEYATFNSSAVSRPYGWMTYQTDTREIGRYSIEGATQEEIIERIDATIAAGGYLHMYGHATNYPGGTIDETKLTAVLSHLQTKVNDGSCYVMNPNEAYRHYFAVRHSDIKGLI